ncbi:MAG: VCBS repeat-containing protein, partial [Bacteroidetes bacterium]|nr:VCBS repeat-containing protein [Bacteroidota bacterium]
MKKSIILSGFLLISLYNALSQSFNDRHIITTGSMPNSANSFNIVDLNGDGNKDILACSTLGRYIYYLQNKGNLEFETIEEFEYDLYELKSVSSGDLNSDGLVDLVYSRIDYSNQLAWHRNIGNNKFVRGGTLYNVPASGWCTVSFAVTDLNEDYVDDVIIISTNNNHNDLLYRLNRGNGQFKPEVSLLDTGRVYSCHSTDIDFDEDDDILFSTVDPYRLIIAVNDGTGNFSERITLNSDGNSQIYNIIVFDTDGDNDNDIMGFTANDSISIYVNEGNNQFSHTHMEMSPLFKNYKINVIDIDNDGDKDIINSYMAILENVGNNRFEFKTDADFPFFLNQYSICDLNENGDEDIVFAMISGGIGIIEDASLENLLNWRTLTSQLLSPRYPAFTKINNDPYPDICLLDTYYKYVFYLNNGKSEFKDTVNVELLHRQEEATRFLDINNDSLSDILSYSDYDNDSSHFRFAKNNGDNTFNKIFINDFDHIKGKGADFIDYDEDNMVNAILFNDYPSNPDKSIYFLNINPDFTINMHDTISLDAELNFFNFKFFDVDNNGQNDLIVNDEHSLLVNYAINDRFNNVFDTLIYSEKAIMDFVFAHINSDTIIDVLYSTMDNIVVLENYYNSSYEDTYQLQEYYVTGHLLSKDLDFDGRDEMIAVSPDLISVIKNITADGYSLENYDYESYTYHNQGEYPLIFNDIDLDGDDDLLATYCGKSDLSWFENAVIDTIGYDLFPEEKAVWTIQNVLNQEKLPYTWTSLFKTESDTLLLSHSYKNIYVYHLDPYTFDTIRQLYASIRQDKLKKKVFIIRQYLSEITERLLLDFKVNVGDTVKLDAYYLEPD